MWHTQALRHFKRLEARDNCCVIPEELRRPAALRWLFLSTRTDSSWFHIRRHCFETPLSSFPSLGKFSFSQSGLPHAAGQRFPSCGLQGQTTSSVYPWGPVKWRAAQRQRSSAAWDVQRGGCSPVTVLQPEPGRPQPAACPGPWLSTALPSHPATRCQTHLPACDSPCSCNGPRNNLGAPPLCRHAVYLQFTKSWHFGWMFIRKQARVLLPLRARKIRLSKAWARVSSLLKTE